ncbi:CAMK family protein kinase [Trichomonas vaginalis G3]|uniref:CAMK family protein kinase n=1 Tax=Trichomonas vaginalis (strain ATCC PRA-98 / G3) TaxID=412133 RepID=A2E7I2_TRIV3|nr:SEL-1-like protein family [Trichomonas vaginalis G3]EAY11375.1 CAMK family protein kinase [Trichomonas vaginalis G3]KAI5530540.1 SEL-1-like protein family [Trichomonas vaginalis G3]|eukprot:XP_001323598.1 CAMK family protein kinase [Trichomonas vaginalis G3]
MQDLHEFNLNSAISLSNIKPHPRSNLRVVKDSKSDNFFVIKVFDSDFNKYPLLSDAQARVSKYNSIKFSGLQKIYQSINNEATNFTLVTPYRSLLSLKRQIKYNQLIDNTFEEKLRLIFLLISSVYALHQNNFIHGNIKPSNILFSSFNTPILADFSLSLSKSTKTGEFSAPELNYRSMLPTMQTDIYSMGMIFKKIIGATQISHDIQDIIDKMISNDPYTRPSAAYILEKFIRNGLYGAKISSEEFCHLFKPLLIPNDLKSLPVAENNVVTKKFEEMAIDEVNNCLINSFHFYMDQNEHHSFENSLNILNIVKENPYGSYNLGLILSRGVITHSNINLSYELFKKAADENINEANVQMAKLILRNQIECHSFQDVQHFLQIAAQNGCSEANYQLGILYQNGISVEKNIELAANYYRLAAQSGHREAQLQYGLMLQNGYDIQKNIKEAANIYSESAKQGNPGAMNQYALLLKEGIGVDKNIKEAAKLFKNAADKENAEAQNNFAIMLQNGQGVPKNIKMAAKYFEKSAKNGNIEAQSNYGWCLKVGAGVEKDIELSTKYFKQSADGGSAIGHNYYGLALLLGQGVHKSDKRAAHQFKLSAEMNDEFGLLNYGMALYDGIGVKQNYTIAAIYIKKSADKGNNQAQFLYANMLKDGIGVERNYSAAAIYYKLAADQGNNDAKFFYAYLLKNGLGIDKNEEEAEKYFAINLNEDDGTRFFNFNSYNAHSNKMSDIRSKYTSNKGFYKPKLDINQMLKNVDLGIDDEESKKFIKMSADQGNVNAMAIYANICNNQDEELFYLQKAAENGHMESIIKLKVLKNKLKPEEKSKLAKELSTCSSAFFKLEYKPENDEEKIEINENVNFDVKINQNPNENEEKEENNDDKETVNDEAIESFKLAADIGIAEAMYQLGRCYEEGKGVKEVDLQLASKYYKKAADLDHIEGCYKYALCCRNGLGVPKNDADALNYFKKGYEFDHDLSKLNYAEMLNEIGGKSNIALAANLFRELAYLGHAEAMYQYAIMLRDGRGVPVDLQRSSHYFLRCATINYKDSGLQYGILISEENGINFFITDVLNYFLLALKEKQTKSAKFMYGLMLVTGIGMKRDLNIGLGALSVSGHERSQLIIDFYKNKDKNRKLIAMKNLADLCCVEAMYSYAMLSLKNGNVDDYISYNKKASEVQFIPAMFEYGKTLFEGKLVEKDLQKGLNLLQFSADNSIHEAQLYLAKERDNGDKIEQDNEEAAKYYNLAMEGDLVEAYFRLGMMHLSQRLNNSDPVYGLKLLKEAMDKGDDDSAIQYAINLHSGKFIEKDLDLSKSILQKLVDEKHNEKAREVLNVLFPEPIPVEEEEHKENEEEKAEEDINNVSKVDEKDEEKDIEEDEAHFVFDDDSVGDDETIADFSQHEEDFNSLKSREIDLDIANEEEEKMALTPQPKLKTRRRKKVRKLTMIDSPPAPHILKKPRRLSDDFLSPIHHPKKLDDSQSTNTQGSLTDDDYPEELVPRARNANFLALTDQDVYKMGSQIFKLNPLERETSYYKQPSIADFFGSQVFEVRKTAAKGSADEQLKLALLLLGTIDENNAEISKENYQEAMQNLMLSSNKGNAFSIYLYNLFSGQEENIKERLIEAANHFKMLADNGDPSAMFIYGLMLRNGFGVKQNLEGAVEYFRRAAKLNHADACYNCGLMIRLGFGAKQNLSRAAYYYYLAAKQRHIYASYNLAILHSNGWGVSKNESLAAYYFGIAARGGDAAAQANLGLMLKNGIGVEKNIFGAVKYFRRSARQGNATGQNNYALILSEGWPGHDPNPEKATIFFRFAAKQGNVSAMYNYAIALLKGVGCKRNPKKAAKILALSSREGDIDSQFKLGYMLYKGERIRKDPIRGLQYLAMAARQGHILAMIMIGRALKNGDFIGQNIELSLKYFKAASILDDPVGLLNYGMSQKGGEGAEYVKKSADLGNVEAQCYYAVMLYSGKEIKRDVESAFYYIKLSADQGYSNAKRLLRIWQNEEEDSNQ